ncbi:MAG TPA: serine protease, partial [Candidatus Angelobacter sp.]|nr:serine protease [Candidatus Angelobacter sp.]
MERSQGHVSLIRRSSWSTFRLIFAVLLLLWPAAAQRARPPSVAVQPQGTDDLAGTLRQNVIRIQAQLQAGPENGFGFIVGESEGRLYIVTAYHVVNDKEQVGESKSNVKVSFYGDQGNSYSAQVLATHMPTPHDLAVLTVPSPPGFQWIRKCLATAKLTRGTSVWSIARGEEWMVQGRPGAVASDRPSADQIIQLDEMKVMRGSSGGPAVSNDGIIGMILTDSADNTKALTIDFIKNAFA